MRIADRAEVQVTLFPVEADLQGVGPGHVRDRAASDHIYDLVVLSAWSPWEPTAVPPNKGRDGQEQGRGQTGSDPLVVQRARHMVEHRCPTLEQQAAAHRSGPAGLIQVGANLPKHRRLLLDQPVNDAGQEVVPVLEGIIPIEGDLVPRRGLPRQAQRLRPHQLVVDRLTVWVVNGGEEEVVGIGVREQARDELVGPVRRMAEEEPEPAAHDRAAESGAKPPDFRDTVLAIRVQPPANEVIVDVAGLEALGREIRGEPAAEAVAALLGNHVDPHPTGLDLGRTRGVIEGDLGEVRLRDPHERVALALPLLHPHPVDLEILVGGSAAVDRQPELGLPTLTTDVVPE